MMVTLNAMIQEDVIDQLTLVMVILLAAMEMMKLIVVMYTIIIRHMELLVEANRTWEITHAGVVFECISDFIV